MTRFGAMVRRIDERQPGVDLPLLSVSQTRGVLRRSELTDKPPRAETLDVYKVCREGDIVFNKMSIRAGALGIAKENGLVTYHYEVMRPLEHADARYLVYLVKSDWFISELIRRERGIGAGGQAGVRTTEVPFKILRTVDAYLPRHNEQADIAAYLDHETSRIDALIEKQGQLTRALQERRSSLIERVVTRGLRVNVPMRSSGISWAYEMPKHWRSGNIRRFAKMRTGHTPSRSVEEYWTDCHIPWLTLADVWQMRTDRPSYVSTGTASMISELGLANSAAELLPAGTVVLSRTASVGFTGIMPVPMATSQDYWNWICGNDLLPEYLVFVFRAMRREIRGLMIGSTHKTIYQAAAAGFTIPVPPVEEQREIVSYLNGELGNIDLVMEKTESLIELARERRSALITAAVTGQIDVGQAV